MGENGAVSADLAGVTDSKGYFTSSAVWRFIPGLSAAAVVVSALWGRVALYADGSNYLYWIVRRRSFYWSSYEHLMSRSEAQVITQAPVRLALAAHFYPLPWLVTLFGVGLFVIPNALWMVAIYRLRESRRFWFFSALYALTLCTQFYAVSESLVTYSLVALVASLVLDGQAPTPRRAWGVALMSLALIASYEITLVLAPLLGALVMTWWWRSGERRRSPALLVPVGTTLASLFAATVLAFLTVHSHAESASPSNALSLAFLSRGGHIVIVATCVALALGASLYLSGRRGLVVVGAAALSEVVLFDPNHWPIPAVAYYGRVYVGLAIGLALALAAPAFFAHRLPRDTPVTKYVVSFLIVVLSVSFVANAEGFGSWNRSLQRIVTTHRGVLPFFSGLGRSVHQFYRYGWFWTTPEQSLLDQTARHQAVVNNPSPSQNFEITPGTPSSYLSPRYFRGA